MADLRARFESWREARERAWLEHARGAGDDAALDVALERADEEHLDVTSGDALPGVRAELDSASFADTRERLRRFANALCGAVAARRTRGLEARIRARPGAVELREERVALESQALGELGFESARAFASALRPDADLARWGVEAEALLARSAAAWRDASSSPAARGAELAKLPSATRLRDSLDFALDGLGVPLARADGLWIDDAPATAVRAFARAPHIPAEVWLVYARVPGLAAQHALFAAAGQALFAGFTSAEQPFEQRALGDPALGLAWGAVLTQILVEPAFAAMVAGDAHSEELVRLVRARRLARLRRAAACARAELALADLSPGGDPHGLAPLYAESVEEALGRAPDEADFLLECSPALASIDLLRARAFAAALARRLRERSGRSWWSTRATGALFAELWHTGTTYTLEGLARELGLVPLGADALVYDHE